MESEETTRTRGGHAGRAHLALGAMVLIWGAGFPITKVALSELDPLAFNALRYPLAALVVMVALRGRVAWPERGDRVRVLLLGILGNLVYQQFFIFGLALTRAGTASVLLASTPIIATVLSAAAGHERLHPRALIGVAATLVGVALVVGYSPAGASGAHSLKGDLLMICASISWAVYTVGSRDLVGRYGSRTFTAWTLMIGALCLTLLGLPSLARTDLGAISVNGWLGVVYAGSLSIGIAYLFWFQGVRVIGNTRTSTYSNLVPVVALFAAWLRLGEVPAAGQAIGAGIILGGVTLAQLAQPAAPSPAGSAPHGVTSGL